MIAFRRRLAARLHTLAGRCHTLACRLDPPVAPPPAVRCADDDELAAVDRHLALWALVDAGRIRRRPGETIRSFSLRLSRGDYVIDDNVIDFDIRRARRAERKASGE